MPVVTFKTHLESQDVYFPRIIVGFTFASDGTQLTDFSDAKLWLLYLTVEKGSRC
jgi:hypothetical protein